MICSEDHIRDMLPDFISGVLEPDQAAEVSEHLQSCAPCARELDILDAVRQQTVPDPGDRFWSNLPGRVLERADEDAVSPADPQRRAPLSKLAWGGAVAAAAILTLLLWPRAEPGIPVPPMSPPAYVEVGLATELIFDFGSGPADVEDQLALNGFAPAGRIFQRRGGTVPEGLEFMGMSAGSLAILEEILDDMVPQG